MASLYAYLNFAPVPTTARFPASAQYESLKGCQKQDELWSLIKGSAYKKFPANDKLGPLELLHMSHQGIQNKATHVSDFAPAGWHKYLHRRGAIAKVKIVPVQSSYSGIFKGAECALLRLSLTYATKGSKPVAPGLALKILRDKTSSANISALVSLEGQEKNFNFFEHPMSNIVPVGTGIGQKLVHAIFRKVTNHPEELVVADMAATDAHGVKAAAVKAPRQLFFVPNADLRFSESEHEVRQDFYGIRSGTVIYQIYAAPEKYNHYDYAQFTHEKVSGFIKESTHIADIVSTSNFLSSAFGDDGIFFKHQIRP